MTAPHLWVRAEQRDNETRVGITPDGVATLLAQGMTVTVEASDSRVIATDDYAATGCKIAPAHSWPDAPQDAIIFGLKELPDDGTPLVHQHIMFGHAYKGQAAGQILLQRFKAGGGSLLDLEYLVDDTGRRVAAFGYWAGFAGAAVALMCWAAQQKGGIAQGIAPYADANALKDDLRARLDATKAARPSALIIGALGRVGTGASDLCQAMTVPVTGWDMEETASGGPFTEILMHDIFLNCILAGPKTPVFVPKSALTETRKLSVVGDIACDPDSAFNPVPVYDRATTWAAPALRVHDTPPLDVMAIDNLPSMLPLESSQDYAAQLLPSLRCLAEDETGVWARARAMFDTHRAALD
ncbi:Saccharopine dehydrogenase (NAD+, L-lysine forming) [Sulfitobacter noctilucae]|uniref:saccharopine dehydrogenase n=1 Tax=Sulfitobacter noctilucae TaxID=1342302 RepID=UPI000469ABCE|nr:saccharopine dehydrogenase [Sulfitobacter noctilucae]KIN75209.1 Saccharopine dehydrogenase (NAD+, L-lysine forming) [Sulfitobacter noctilucae]